MSSLGEIWRRIKKYSLRTVDNNNIFQYTTPDFYVVTKRDFFFQLLGTIIAFSLLVWLDVESIKVTLNTPEVSNEIEEDPSPEFILDLFNKREATAINCPCRNANPRIADFETDWTMEEDAFCSTIRSTLSTDTPQILNKFVNDILSSPSNRDCIEGGKGGVRFAEFLENVRNLVAGTGMFPGTRGEAQWDDATSQFANILEDSLCAYAFGTYSQENYVTPLDPLSSELVNECSSGRFQNEEFHLGPDAFDNSTTPANIVPLSQTRGFSLLSSSASTCSTLYTLREGFKSSVKDTTLSFPFALNPLDLKRIIETSFNTSLAFISVRADGWVPGFNPLDTISSFTDPTNILAPISRITEPPTDITTNSFAFSSRLPFVRTDFINGAATHFYVTTEFGDPPNRFARPPRIPLFAGLGRLVVFHPNTTSLPFKELEEDRSTQGYQPNSPWVPVGDDFLTVLEACRNGYPLQLDVHNLRAVDLAPMYRNVTAYGVPFNASGFNRGGFCSLAAGSPRNLPSPLVFPPEQPKLFSLPINCPPLISFMANAQGNSTYNSLKSPVRFSIKDFLHAFPTVAANPSTATLPPTRNELQRRLLELRNRGDTSERTDILALLMAKRGVGFNISYNIKAHYRTCNPSFCAWNVIQQRSNEEMALEAVASFGGNGAFIVSLMALIIAYLACFGRRYDQFMKTAEEKRAEKEAKILEEEQGAPCNCPHCPCSTVATTTPVQESETAVRNPLSLKETPSDCALELVPSSPLLHVPMTQQNTNNGEGGGTNSATQWAETPRGGG